MPKIITNASGKGNTILVVAVGFLTLVMMSAQVGGQTTNWSGTAGDVWTRAGSWGLGVPGAGSIGVIDGGSGSILALRETGSSGSVAVGTLILSNPSYTSIVSGASAATLGFGSGTSAFRLAPSTGTVTFTMVGKART